MIARTKYVIIPVDIAGGGSTQKFSFKIPEDFVLVDGYMATSINDGIVANGVLVALLSLSFNSKASTPVFTTVQTDKLAFKKRKFGFLKLLEPVKGGTYIEGWLLNVVFPVPAGCKMNIYLKGKQAILENKDIDNLTN